MTEKKKKRTPAAKWLIAYLIYAAACVLGSYGVSAAYAALRHQMSVTFQSVPYMLASFGLFVLLGILWACESLFAKRVGKLALLAVRLVTMLLLTVLSIGWAVMALFGAGAAVSIGIYAPYANGCMPVLALVVGWLVVNTVLQVFKRA